MIFPNINLFFRERTQLIIWPFGGVLHVNYTLSLDKHVFLL